MPALRTALALVLLALPALAQTLHFGDPERDELPPFFTGPHDPEVPSPRSLLGREVGTRLAHHAEIVDLWRLWEAASDRVRVEVAGHSHEGRELLRVIVSSPGNLARLDDVRDGLQRLVDPRGLSEADAEALMDELPAVAFMGYSIHGDELSGADAGLAVGWHLAAGTGDDVQRLLDQLVVVIDPCMNPDGRERIVGQVEQMTGYVPNLDHAAMQRGRWPWGRGNHYLFDINRDWMTGTMPETRARWASARDLPPQLFVDAHEMGSLDTFLMYPQSAPHNPFLPTTLDRWQKVFAADAAAAFDAHGWSYYTREWADAWGPYYSDAWGSLSGAVGILYEQASTSGFPLRNAQGRVLTYREAVHHQVTASLANLGTAAAHRRELLADFAEHFRRSVDPGAAGNDRMLAVIRGRNPTRERALLDMLLGQHVEVFELTDHLTVTDARDTLGFHEDELDLPPGTWLVPAAQPYGALVKSYLLFDVRIDDETLRLEREDLLRTGATRMYDATSWSLPLQLDVEAWWCDAADVGRPVTSVEGPAGGVVGADGPPVAWIVDGADDASVAFAARAMERWLVVAVSDEAFESGGRRFARGSVVVRTADNEGDPAARVAAAAAETGVTAYAVSTGRAPGDGADLGGGHFGLLSRPRVAMVSGAPVAPDTFGHLWHVLDTRLGVPVSFLDTADLGWADLRRYNVIVLPPGAPVAEHERALGEWVSAGGTLVAVGSAAGATAATGLTSVTRRRDALDELEGYAVAARRDAQARDVVVDPAAVWGDEAPLPDDVPAEGDDGEGDDEDDDEDGKAAADGAVIDPDAERQDAWARRFSPAGVFLRAFVDQHHWLTSGAGPELPVLVSGSTALLSREPVATPVRLASSGELRLSGLLWPESAERLADSAWATVERRGHGQVILMADVPGFRGQFLSGARLFGNAVVFGPGLGADQPVGW